MLKGILCVTFFFLLTFVSNEDKRNRQVKLLSFNAEAEDVEVGLDFSIPFIKIPLKKTFNAVAEFGIPGISLSKININPIALVLGGMIIIFTSLVVPFVSKAFDWHHLERSSRNDDDINNFQTFYLTEQLVAHSRACPERVACWAGRRNKNAEHMQTWKHIMSNKLLSTMVNTTALKEATMRGIKGHDCDSYTPCPIDEKALPKLMKNFEFLTNSR
ncbi:uncharacterized protein LOC126776159 [Nymphalis io]|uniref:uncharacterized protein LOC126776159 n=1 Tax=Inachis io TaxID=171585 RepID=UPI002169583C|nr:uncharacterized protein LOC126776159 [Nymphalis io]